MYSRDAQCSPYQRIHLLCFFFFVFLYTQCATYILCRYMVCLCVKKCVCTTSKVKRCGRKRLESILSALSFVTSLQGWNHLNTSLFYFGVIYQIAPPCRDTRARTRAHAHTRCCHALKRQRVQTRDALAIAQTLYLKYFPHFPRLAINSLRKVVQLRSGTTWLENPERPKVTFDGKHVWTMWPPVYTERRWFTHSLQHHQVHWS